MEVHEKFDTEVVPRIATESPGKHRFETNGQRVASRAIQPVVFLGDDGNQLVTPVTSVVSSACGTIQEVECHPGRLHCNGGSPAEPGTMIADSSVVVRGNRPGSRGRTEPIPRRRVTHEEYDPVSGIVRFQHDTPKGPTGHGGDPSRCPERNKRRCRGRVRCYYADFGGLYDRFLLQPQITPVI